MWNWTTTTSDSFHSRRRTESERYYAKRTLQPIESRSVSQWFTNNRAARSRRHEQWKDRHSDSGAEFVLLWESPGCRHPGFRRRHAVLTDEAGRGTREKKMVSILVATASVRLWNWESYQGEGEVFDLMMQQRLCWRLSNDWQCRPRWDAYLRIRCTWEIIFVFV